MDQIQELAQTQPDINLDCVTCIQNKYKFCFKDYESYCCDAKDTSTTGCNPQKYTCTENEQILMLSQIFSSSLMKSENFELCPHYANQCLVQEDMFKSYKAQNVKSYLHQPTQVDVTDDGLWEELSIQSINGTACSYFLENNNSTTNAFEIKIIDSKNVKIGIYYYSSLINSMIDLGIFNSNDCGVVKHCVKSDRGFIMILLERTEYMVINVIPDDVSSPYLAYILFRLINKEEKTFVKETLTLMGIGFVQNSPTPSSNRSSAKKENTKELDQTANLGLDWFTFQTQIRKLVLDLIEPTVIRGQENYELSKNLQKHQVTLKLKVDEMDRQFSTQLSKTLTAGEINDRLSEMVLIIVKFQEQTRLKDSDRQWIDIQKSTANLEIMREKMNSIQEEVYTFMRMNENLNQKVADISEGYDQSRKKINETITKFQEQQEKENYDIKARLYKFDEAITTNTYLIENHRRTFLDYDNKLIQLRSYVDSSNEDLQRENDKILKEFQKNFEVKLARQREDINQDLRDDIAHSKREVLFQVGLVDEIQEVKIIQEEIVTQQPVEINIKRRIKKCKHKSLRSQDSIMLKEDLSLDQIESSRSAKLKIKNLEYMNKFEINIFSPKSVDRQEGIVDKLQESQERLHISNLKSQQEFKIVKLKDQKKQISFRKQNLDDPSKKQVFSKNQVISFINQEIERLKIPSAQEFENIQSQMQSLAQIKYQSQDIVTREEDNQELVMNYRNKIIDFTSQSQTTLQQNKEEINQVLNNESGDQIQISHTNPNAHNQKSKFQNNSNELNEVIDYTQDIHDRIFKAIDKIEQKLDLQIDPLNFMNDEAFKDLNSSQNIGNQIDTTKYDKLIIKLNKQYEYLSDKIDKFIERQIQSNFSSGTASGKQINQDQFMQLWEMKMEQFSLKQKQQLQETLESFQKDLPNLFQAELKQSGNKKDIIEIKTINDQEEKVRNQENLEIIEEESNQFNKTKSQFADIDEIKSKRSTVYLRKEDYNAQIEELRENNQILIQEVKDLIQKNMVRIDYIDDEIKTNFRKAQRDKSDSFVEVNKLKERLELKLNKLQLQYDEIKKELEDLKSQVFPYQTGQQELQHVKKEVIELPSYEKQLITSSSNQIDYQIFTQDSKLNSQLPQLQASLYKKKEPKVDISTMPMLEQPSMNYAITSRSKNIVPKLNRFVESVKNSTLNQSENLTSMYATKNNDAQGFFPIPVPSQKLSRKVGIGNEQKDALQLVNPIIDWENVRTKESSQISNYIISNRNTSKTPLKMKPIMAQNANSVISNTSQAPESQRFSHRRGGSSLA